MAYHKLFYGNDIFYSVTYQRAEQTDDTVVLLKGGCIGRISLIYEGTESVFLLLKVLEVQRVPNFPMHIKKVCKNKDDKFEIVRAENISQKLLLISTVNESYVTELPNQFEGD